MHDGAVEGYRVKVNMTKVEKRVLRTLEPHNAEASMFSRYISLQ